MVVKRLTVKAENSLTVVHYILFKHFPWCMGEHQRMFLWMSSGGRRDMHEDWGRLDGWMDGRWISFYLDDKWAAIWGSRKNEWMSARRCFHATLRICYYTASSRVHTNYTIRAATWFCNMFMRVPQAVGLYSHIFLTKFRLRIGGPQGNQIHSGILCTLGIPKMYLGTLGYNIQILQ